MLTENKAYIELETDGKLLPIKDIVKLYRKVKYGDTISTESLKQTLKQLNKDFQRYSIKDTERSLFFAVIIFGTKTEKFADG